MSDYHMRRKELCEYLRIKEPTLYQWVREGRIPKGFKIGKFRLWDKAQIDSWLESRKEKACE